MWNSTFKCDAVIDIMSESTLHGNSLLIKQDWLCRYKEILKWVRGTPVAVEE
jgi:hypothetical protein